MFGLLYHLLEVSSALFRHVVDSDLYTLGLILNEIHCFLKCVSNVSQVTTEIILCFPAHAIFIRRKLFPHIKRLIFTWIEILLQEMDLKTLTELFSEAKLCTLQH